MHGPPLDLSRSNPFYCNRQISAANASRLLDVSSRYAFVALRRFRSKSDNFVTKDHSARGPEH